MGFTRDVPNFVQYDETYPQYEERLLNPDENASSLDEARAERSRDFIPADFITRPTMLTPTARAPHDQLGAGPERSARPEQHPSHAQAPGRRSDRRSGVPHLPGAA